MDIAQDERRAFLESCDIKELRLMGKDLRIKTPTSLSKENLINDLLTITYTADFDCPNEKSNRKFRLEKGSLVEEFATKICQAKVIDYGFKSEIKPMPKPIELDEKPQIDLSKYEGTVVNYYSNAIDTKQFSTANLSTTISRYEIASNNDDENDGVAYTGFVDVINKDYVIRYDTNKFVLLPSDIVNKYEIKRYDSIVFKGFYSPCKNESYLVQILNINGLAPERYERCSFDHLSVEPPTELFDIPRACIKKVTGVDTALFQGAKFIIYGNNQAKKEKVITGLVNELVKIKVPVFPIFLGKDKECWELLDRLMPNATFASASENPECVIEKLLAVIYKALRYVELGLNTVVVIDDFNGVYSALEALLPNQNATYITTMVAKFFNIGGLYSSGGSITVLGLVNNENIRLLEKLKKCASVKVSADKLNKATEDYEVSEETMKSFYEVTDPLKIIKHANKLVADNANKPKIDGLKDLNDASLNLLDKLNKL